jgi:hypothetical protein
MHGVPLVRRAQRRERELLPADPLAATTLKRRVPRYGGRVEQGVGLALLEVFVVTTVFLLREPSLGADGDVLDQLRDLVGGRRGRGAPQHRPVVLPLEAAVYREDMKVNVQG